MQTNTENLKPIVIVNYALVLVLLVFVAVNILALFSGIWRALTYVMLPENPTLEEIPFLADQVYLVVGQIHGFANLPIAIIFGIWLYRMNFNLRKLTTRSMEFTPGWMIGWYLIPIANLFKPFQGMRELWRISHKKWDVNPPILIWWWGLWLVSRFLQNSTFPIENGPNIVQNTITSTSISILAHALNIAVAIVTLRIIVSIWFAYEEKYINNVDDIDEDIKIHKLKEIEQVSV